MFHLSVVFLCFFLIPNPASPSQHRLSPLQSHSVSVSHCLTPLFSARLISDIFVFIHIHLYCPHVPGITRRLPQSSSTLLNPPRVRPWPARHTSRLWSHVEACSGGMGLHFVDGNTKWCLNGLKRALGKVQSIKIKIDLATTWPARHTSRLWSHMRTCIV